MAVFEEMAVNGSRRIEAAGVATTVTTGTMPARATATKAKPRLGS